MSVLQYNKVIKYRADVVCDSLLHIGDSNGNKEEILIHPVSGLPYVQASGIAGAFRSACQQLYNADQTDNLFGISAVDENSSNRPSCIRFGDGVFDKENIRFEIRPHLKIDKQTGTVDAARGSGQKYNMEYLAAGSRFTFDLYLFLQGEDKEGFRQMVEILFSELKCGNIVFGGRKSSGTGKIHLSALYRKEFDLCSETGRKNWMIEETLPLEQYSSGIERDLDKADEYKNYAYQIVVNGETEGAMQIRGIAVTTPPDANGSVPDSDNIKNTDGDYIIPGSSFRGAMRGQMEKIAEYLKCQNLIEQSFGKGGEPGENGKTGCLMFSDTVIGDRLGNDRSTIVRKRIHIDKFSGGVMHGELFDEKNVFGSVQFKIGITREVSDGVPGLVILALRDLAIHTFSLGNGYANGKGFINVSNITICDVQNDKQVQIDIKDQDVKITGCSDIIKGALKELEGVKVCQ